MKKISLFLLVTMIIVSCKKEVPLTFSEMNFTSEKNAIVEVNIPRFEGNIELANKINKKIEQLISQAITRTKDESISTLIEATKAFDNEFQIFNKALSEASQPWEAFADGEVTYQSSEIICVAINTYINTGGAHGNSVISFLNFNPLNGELYKNEELIKDMQSLKIITESYFNKMIQEREDSDEISFQFPETIGFNEEGIIILLNSNGLIIDSPEFTIPYEEFNDHLKVH